MRIIIVSVLLLFNITAFTQMENRFEGGVLLGLASTQINGDGYAGYNRVGWTAGFFLERQYKDRWTFLTELAYITKGSLQPPNTLSGNFNTLKIRLNYVEMPFIFKYHIKKFRVMAGPSIGFLVGEKQFRDGVEAVGLDVIIGPFKKFEISSQIGVEYEVGEKSMLSWRYSTSMLPVANRLIQDPTSIFGFAGGSYNQLMTISLRVKI